MHISLIPEWYSCRLIFCIWCFVLWFLYTPTRVALCGWGRVLCHFKQNQGSGPVKDAQAWSDWGHVYSESWVLHIRLIVMCESNTVCFSSLFCLKLAGIVWKGVNSFFLLCFSCCWPTKDENDYSGWFLLSGKEPNLIKMRPRKAAKCILFFYSGCTVVVLVNK